MKRIKSDIKYTVPSWGFCNIDTGTEYTAKINKELCRFCVKVKGQYRCLLHNEPLLVDGSLVEKTEGCKEATAGFGIEIFDPAQPQVNPIEIIKLTLDEYEKQIKALISQGYPYALAKTLAKKYMTGGK